MTDLVTWYLAQLDEDGRLAGEAAEAAGEPDWRTSSDENIYGAERNTNNPVAIGPWDCGLFGIGPHIARWDPAAVLAEIAAHRAIVSLHAITVRTEPRAPFNPYTGERQGPDYDVDCMACGWASDDPTSACETLRILAAAYADRPGYRAEWKP